MKTLENVALLAAFIPIISGMSGNSGTQSLAVSVRNITTGEINEQSKFRIALREAEVVYYRALYVQQYYLQLLLQYIISHF